MQYHHLSGSNSLAALSLSRNVKNFRLGTRIQLQLNGEKKMRNYSRLQQTKTEPHDTYIHHRTYRWRSALVMGHSKHTEGRLVVRTPLVGSASSRTGFFVFWLEGFHCVMALGWSFRVKPNERATYLHRYILIRKQSQGQCNEYLKWNLTCIHTYILLVDCLTCYLLFPSMWELARKKALLVWLIRGLCQCHLYTQHTFIKYLGNLVSTSGGIIVILTIWVDVLARK